MKKKHILLFISIIVIMIFGLLYYIKSKEVTFYLIVGNAQAKNINVSFVLNGDSVFNDNLMNHRYEVKVIEKDLDGGYQNLQLFSNGELLDERKVLVLFQNHIVIEFNDNCIGNIACFKIDKRFTPFRLE